MIVFAEKYSPRLKYITGFIGQQIHGEPWILTDDLQYYKSFNGPKINYSVANTEEPEIRIEPHKLLFEDDIKDQEIIIDRTREPIVFFSGPGDMGFDIFAAAFYLISRYEEYLPHKVDEYGRYDHRNSLAVREGFLDKPVVDQWILELKKTIELKFHFYPIASSSAFRFLPTYDIDIAWSYKNKGSWRNLGGIGLSVISGRFPELGSRIKVLREKEQDPFDSYQWLDELHARYKMSPWYFFLLASESGVYDKNISPEKLAMQDLIRQHAAKYPVGIHPSWRSGDNARLVAEEKEKLAEITKRDVSFSRQHYIRFKLPDTFRELLKVGIHQDFSMGYGSINGFRASACSPFYWFDLLANLQTDLMLFPFCYMDANSIFEQKYSPEQAYAEMLHYLKVVREVEGTLIMIWHNHILGTDPRFKGWREVYEQFIETCQAQVNA